jgi:ATP/maltotriose-dependent transcriptional regulator MalT
VQRTARWCGQNGLAGAALEYSIAAGDVATAAGLIEQLAVPARAVTLQRWLRWLDEYGRIEDHPGVAALSALIFSWSGRPGEAEIAAELAISHNTVKSETASLYRKLLATSREQAVARSRELSLLDG